MVEPQSFKFVTDSKIGVEVYNLEDLIQFDQAYFYGCLKRKREVLIKKNISPQDYFYAKITKKGWEESNESYSRAKILIKSDWVKSNVTKFVDKYDKENASTQIILKEAPPILKLEEHEKFRDDTGNLFEVEVRGVREEDKIYFKAIDIEKLFEMDNLIRHNIKRLLGGNDYINFVVQINNKFQKYTFLTIDGIKKLICRSRSISPSKLKWFLSNAFIIKIGICFDIISLYKEQEIINVIVDNFMGHETIKQFSIGKYRVDLWFPEYNLVVECDEFNHQDRNFDAEYNREKYIKKRLNCTFIRFNPDEIDFKLGFIIKLIYDHIHEKTCLKYQKMLLQEKDARITDLNREISGYTQREQEWKNREKEWQKRESDLLSELMVRNTIILKELKIKFQDNV